MRKLGIVCLICLLCGTVLSAAEWQWSVKGEWMRVKRDRGTAGSVPVDTSCVRTGGGDNGGTTEYVGRNVVSSFRIP